MEKLITRTLAAGAIMCATVAVAAAPANAAPNDNHSASEEPALGANTAKHLADLPPCDEGLLSILDDLGNQCTPSS